MKNFLILFFSVAIFNCIAQQSETPTTKSDTLHHKELSAEKINFPEKCLGVWEGTMYIHYNSVLRDSVSIKFTAAKTDTVGTYIWKTEYISPKTPMVKDYKLIVDNENIGTYLLDEGEDIQLVTYNVNNKLYCLFKVDDIYLTSSTELINNNLVFEVTSGKQINNNQEVTSYTYTNIQRAVLHKIE